MRDSRPSTTAWVVAYLRAMGSYLPSPYNVAEDPYAPLFLPPLVRVSLRAPGLRRGLAVAAAGSANVWYLPLRTRAIDDALLDFLRADGSGAQVLILGAGYDARAYRLADALCGARVFEVDHPATQGRKLRRLAGAHLPAADVRHVPFDFEVGPAALPARLDAHGFDRAARTFAVWEGVTMYLSEPTIESMLQALRALLPPGAELCFTYFDRRHLRAARTSVLRGLARAAGEPMRFGWDPPALPAWLAARGWSLVRDDDTAGLVRRYVPSWTLAVPPKEHVALARRTP